MKYDLKRLRESFGVSRKLLSKITGIPYRTIQNWELREREFSKYEYENILYRLKERQEILNFLINEPSKECQDYFWFSDKNGYGIIVETEKRREKVYSSIPIAYFSIDRMRTWAEWTAESCRDDFKWENR